MTETLTVDEFLLARIAERERIAQVAAESTSPTWNLQTPAAPVIKGLRLWASGTDLQWPDLAHIAANDPARVLAECEAQRRIVRLHTGKHNCMFFQGHAECATLTWLAQPHAEHEDFKEEWRP